MVGESAIAINTRWEVTRLVRSRRVGLLLIPPVAGPIGSAIADLYLRIPSASTALILGLLVTAGLAALILIDLTALAVGEDLALRAHLLFFTLPQDRAELLAGRLLVAIAGPIGAFALGAGGIELLGGHLITAPTDVTPIFEPAHLFLGLLAFLLFLAGVTAAASVVTRSSSEAIVAGVLAGVVGAGATGYLEFERQLSLLFPVVLAVAGAAALGWALYAYRSLAS